MVKSQIEQKIELLLMEQRIQLLAEVNEAVEKKKALMNKDDQ